MDGLNYHHLFYFWTIARTGSIAKASVELGLTQPTISEQLRLLEKSLGDTLFERVGRSLVLTEKGSTVLQYANKIFALGEELTVAVSEHHSSLPQKLRIAAAPNVSATLLAEILRPLAKLKSVPALSITSDSAEGAMTMLRDGNLDLVLSPDPDLLKAFPGTHRHLLHECGAAFFGMRAPSARFPKSLHEQTIVLPAEPVRSQLLRWLKTNRVVVETTGEAESPDYGMALAEGGFGVIALPDLPSFRMLKLKPLGRTDKVRWKLYGFTAERRPRHSGLAVIIRSRRAN